MWVQLLLNNASEWTLFILKLTSSAIETSFTLHEKIYELSKILAFQILWYMQICKHMNYISTLALCSMRSNWS